MHLKFIWLTIASHCLATPLLSQGSVIAYQELIQQHWLDKSHPAGEQRKFTVTHESDVPPFSRAYEIERKRRGYLYGPSLLGNTSYFPAGILGEAMVQQHMHQWLQDAAWVTSAVEDEVNAAATALEKLDGLQSINDYRVLYDNQWQSTVPSGPAQGTLSNLTQDLLFSMERLSVNPYSIRRLHPIADTLPFDIDPAVSINLSGVDTQALHKSGRLFYADHSYQAAYPTTPGKYVAACSAYFFLHPKSGIFLPLAIKTNAGADLIYTPLDTEEDWLLAKTMFNTNDLFHGQIYHLANSHAINEIIHLAALRTLSSLHPVLGLLDRLMHHAYAIRPIGEKVLFNSGGFFDQSFAITNRGVRMFSTEFYPSKAGPFQANYFYTDLITRGLINCTYGPSLQSFPFFDDANVLHSSIHDFMTSFVNAYYKSDDLLILDEELQSWIRESTQNALAIDFPPFPLVYKRTLVDVLTQFAFLAGVSHHVLNSGEPVKTSGVLPLHPSAIYSPLPKEKGIKDIMPYLTPPHEALKHIALLARFNRPQLELSNETLLYMFSSNEFLNGFSIEIGDAASTFFKEMRSFSDQVRQRQFDKEGLCQGMPFVWQGLDPSRIPFFLSV